MCFLYRFLDAERISEVQFNPDLLLMIGIGLGSILGGLLLIWASQVCFVLFFKHTKDQKVLVLIATLARLDRYEDVADFF